MWKSVVWAPAATSLVSSATVWLLSRWVHLAVRRRALPSLATEAWMVSPLAKLVSGVATRLSASIALPRVTVVGATAGASTGAGAVVTGSAGALGGVAGTGSSRPQPTRDGADGGGKQGLGQAGTVHGDVLVLGASGGNQAAAGG